MEYHRQAPAPDLAQLVDYYWYFHGLDAGHSREHVIPDGTVELIIDLRDEPRRLYDREARARHRTFRASWVSGPQSGHIVIDVRAGASMIGAHFRPGGAGPILGLPAEAITDNVVELADLWSGGSASQELRERLLGARGPAAKFKILEEFLRRRLGRALAARWNPHRVAAAVHRLASARGAGSISGLAGTLGISHKHFIDEFRRAVGLTPKRFAQICRFHGVLTTIRARRAIEWADVAVQCGYYDQAHFIRDFHTYAGLNPTEFLARTVDDPKFIPVEDWDVG